MGNRILSVCLILIFASGVLFAQLSLDERNDYNRQADLSEGFGNALQVTLGHIELLDFPLRVHQISFLDQTQLRLLRNTIYAKYGYQFRSQDLLEHFSKFDWYEPTNSFSESQFRPVDRANIEIIRFFENSFSGDDRSIKEGLIYGTWHDSPWVAAGYGQRYFLNEDGTFRWESAESDGGKRLYSFSGEWFLDGSILYLEVVSYRWLHGGEITEPFASYGSDFVIEGGDLKTVDISMDTINLRIPLTEYILDESFGRVTMKIARQIFFKMES